MYDYRIDSVNNEDLKLYIESLPFGLYDVFLNKSNAYKKTLDYFDNIDYTMAGLGLNEFSFKKTNKIYGNWEQTKDGYLIKRKTPLKKKNLPTKVIFNSKKKATTLLYDNKPTVVRCGEKEKFDKRIGFLEAYFKANCGLSRTQANKYLKELE